jgi:hypothetical protein
VRCYKGNTTEASTANKKRRHDRKIVAPFCWWEPC